MIKIDALYFLLLIELLVVLAGMTVFYILRGKKSGALYRSGLKELADLRSAREELQQQLTETRENASQSAAEAGDASTMQKTAARNHENCKIELSILDEKLKESNKLLVELQTKYDDLEKEYLILYRQQQAQEQKKS